jgi:hypothetical protein
LHRHHTRIHRIESLDTAGGVALPSGEVAATLVAGISNRCASVSIGVTFAAPSTIDYSVWLCKCTKGEEFIGRTV